MLNTTRLCAEQLDNKVKGASRICLLGDRLLRVSGCSTQSERYGIQLRFKTSYNEKSAFNLYWDRRGVV